MSGAFGNGQRLKGNVKNRSLVTLDVDYAGQDFWDNFTLINDYAAALYSTHKHTPKSPRLRLIIPLKRPVTPEQYEAIAGRIADDINIELFDDTTYQPSRLMYWPSTPKDGVYLFKVQEGPILDPRKSGHLRRLERLQLLAGVQPQQAEKKITKRQAGRSLDQERSHRSFLPYLYDTRGH